MPPGPPRSLDSSGELPSPSPTTFGSDSSTTDLDGSGTPRDYAKLVRTLEQRSLSRSSSTPTVHGARVGTDAAAGPVEDSTNQLIEQDLRLAAQIGQTLLTEKAALQSKLEQSERANQKLLERLNKAVKENKAFERRLEESLGNLDQADSSNRALLVSLEEDRKTISRLSHDSGRLVAVSTTLKQLQIAHADALEDLAAERKRADAAETRARKAHDRAEDLDERLRKACSDLEEMRQDKVLSAKRSSDALALLKARQAAASDSDATKAEGAGAGTDQTQTRELMRIVETLVEENHLLRSESMELHGLLEREREDQELAREENGFLSALGIRTDGDDAHNDDGTEIEPETDEVPRRRSGFLPRRLSGSSAFSRTSPRLDQSQSSFAKVPSESRPTPARTRSGASAGKIPVGRPRNRRTQSMGITAEIRPLDLGTTSVPSSPSREEQQTLDRSTSFFSNASEDADNSLSSSGRPKRRHRPLSLSLNSSVFSNAPTAAVAAYPDAEQSILVSPFTRPNAHRRQSSQASFQYGLASPRAEHAPTRSMRSPRPSPSRRPSTIARVDAATQTVQTEHGGSTHAISEDDRPRTPVPARDSESRSTITLTASPASSSAARTRSETPGSGRAQAETRTAALGQLIEHGNKLLARVQSADIATQEQRLRKQHLAGDVKHLAQATLRELAQDIDSMRDRFRRVVELERAAQHRDNLSAAVSSNGELSLVVRRDFVSLVKLLRDLLSETSRLRLLVNRVQLEPSLAHKLRELDAPAATSSAAPADKTLSHSAGSAATTLLAPITRLLGVQSTEQPAMSDNMRPSLARSRRGGSSTVSTATVNVEYGGGAVRAAETVESPRAQLDASPRDATAPAGRPRQVRRELSSIFAGASSASTAARRPPPAAGRSQGIEAPTQPRAVPTNRFVSAAASAASSYMPFGRILASYRPAMSSTANAVLDSIPHAPPALDSPFDDDDDNEQTPPSTLLERQLRPRGLSDSSIRSTFTTHGDFSRPNPHHRVVTAAGLALSAETRPVPIVVATGDTSLDRASERDAAIAAMSSSPASLGAAMSALRQKLEEDEAETAHALAEGKTISRRASRAQLRGRASTSRLRESTTLAVSPPPPVPPLPEDLRLSTSTATSDSSLTLPRQTSSPNPAIAIDEAPASPAAPAPISISPSSRTGTGVRSREKDGGGTTSLFGTVVSSAFGSLVGAGSSGSVAGGGDKRSSTLGSHGPPDSRKDWNRFG